MPFVVINGQPTWEPDFPEVTVEIEVSDLTCPECGKEYKTQRGLDNHSDTH